MPWIGQMAVTVFFIVTKIYKMNPSMRLQRYRKESCVAQYEDQLLIPRRAQKVQQLTPKNKPSKLPKLKKRTSQNEILESTSEMTEMELNTAELEQKKRLEAQQEWKKWKIKKEKLKQQQQGRPTEEEVPQLCKDVDSRNSELEWKKWRRRKAKEKRLKKIEEKKKQEQWEKEKEESQRFIQERSIMLQTKSVLKINSPSKKRIAAKEKCQLMMNDSPYAKPLSPIKSKKDSPKKEKPLRSPSPKGKSRKINTAKPGPCKVKSKPPKTISPVKAKNITKGKKKVEKSKKPNVVPLSLPRSAPELTNMKVLGETSAPNIGDDITDGGSNPIEDKKDIKLSPITLEQEENTESNQLAMIKNNETALTSDPVASSTPINEPHIGAKMFSHTISQEKDRVDPNDDSVTMRQQECIDQKSQVGIIDEEISPENTESNQVVIKSQQGTYDNGSTLTPGVASTPETGIPSEKILLDRVDPNDQSVIIMRQQECIDKKTQVNTSVEGSSTDQKSQVGKIDGELSPENTESNQVVMIKREDIKSQQGTYDNESTLTPGVASTPEINRLQIETGIPEKISLDRVDPNDQSVIMRQQECIDQKCQVITSVEGSITDRKLSDIDETPHANDSADVVTTIPSINMQDIKNDKTSNGTKDELLVATAVAQNALDEGIANHRPSIQG